MALDATKGLVVGGTTTIDADGALTLDRDEFSTGSLDNTAGGTFNWVRGTLNLTGGGSDFGPNPLIMGSGGSATLNLLTGNDATFASLSVGVSSTVNLAGGTWTTGSVNNAGRLRVLLNPTVDFGTGLTNTGDLVLIDTTVTGTVTSPAGSAINMIGTVTFNDLVSGAGGIFGSGTAVFNGGHQPGDSAAIVPVEGNVVYGASNTLFMELGGVLDGQFDRLDVQGEVVLGGNLSVQLIDDFTLDLGQQFTILNVVGGLSDQFSGLDEGALVGTFNEALFITYAGGDGNDVAVYTVPEPSTLVLLGIGVLALLAYAWRRHRRR